MKTQKRLLVLLLVIALVLSSIQFKDNHVHADEWEECAHCGKPRSPDWLCDSCGGCGIESMNDCFFEHHCPCGACYEDIPICSDCRQCLDCVSGDVMCVDCGRCEECAGKICEGCQRCSDCVGLEEYCTGCDLCADCMGEGYCYECGLCGDCTTLCARFDCPFCEECSGWVCDNCGQCAFCAFDLRCENCGICNDCCGPICGGCEYCSDCGTVCISCEDCCSNCSEVCESCEQCENCLSLVICPDCQECSNCTGATQCENCYHCSNCVQICEDCGDVCEDCADFCQECNRCEDCVHLCHDCGEYCFECKEYCHDCESCEECVNLCEECGEVCDNCVNFCQECNKCEICVNLCEGCGEVCENCATFCEECGVVCDNCADFCQECNRCENCVELCHDCRNYCFECKGYCHDCESCEECANLCEECGEVCDNCVDFCKECNKCESCVDLCEDCGEICHDCAKFCLECNKCENCINLCEECGEVCDSCANFCVECNKCENCVNLCSNCGKNCDNCLQFCQGCNACSDCGYACPSCGQFCSMCQEDWVYISLDNTKHQWQCSCGGFVDSPRNHILKYEVRKIPTATELGFGELKCTYCNYKEIIPIPSTGGGEHYHDFSLWVSTSLFHERYCVCGAKDPSSKGNHELIWVVDIEATIENSGLKHQECNICGYKLPGESVAPIDHTHDYGTMWGFDSFSHWHSCNCGHRSDIDSHSMEEWILTRAATETTPGSEERKCKVCDYKQVRVIPSTSTELSIRFDCNGGSSIPTQSVINGGKAIKPENPSRPGYIFTGWYTTTSGTKPWNFEHLIYESRTLYAQWSLVETPELPTISTASLIKGVVGIPYNEILEASGNTPITWSILGGKLPNGLTLNSITGKISGKPTEEGTFIIMVKAENKYDYDLKSYTIIVENKIIESIRLTNQPIKRTYVEGEKFDPKGMKVEILWTDGTKTDITDGVNYNQDELTRDITKIKIIYKDVELGTNFEDVVYITVKGKDIGGGSSSFVITYYTITTNVGVGGKIDTGQVGNVGEGESRRFIIKPDEGYTISDVKVDGKSVGVVSNYEFTNVRSNHNITATFKKIEDTDFSKYDFIDVLESDWYYEPVIKACDKGWFSGTSDTTFSPNKAMARGMIVTVLWRIEGEPSAKSHNFNDVSSDKYYEDAIKWVAEHGIANGYHKDSFGPDDKITRQQMLTILYRYAQYKGYDTTQGGMGIREFGDYESISKYALPALAWAVNTGLAQGSDNNIMPKESATRAQVAAILMRFNQNVVK